VPDEDREQEQNKRIQDMRLEHDFAVGRLHPLKLMRLRTVVNRVLRRGPT
jgi:hypothetical protein